MRGTFLQERYAHSLGSVVTGRELNHKHIHEELPSFPIAIAYVNEGRRESQPFKEMENKTRIGSEKKKAGLEIALNSEIHGSFGLYSHSDEIEK